MRSRRVALLAMIATVACRPAWATDTFDYPGLGTVSIERPVGQPRHVVLFLSGDGGWNKGVVDMARHLVDEGALVAGVDVTQVQRHAQAAAASCVGAAAMLERLSHYVQQKYGVRDYQRPVLVGYSSGATLAYGALAQAPAGTFKGAVSLGFCPDLEWTRPLCRGEGLGHDPAPKSGFVYRPAQHLQDPWILLQGEQDQVCDAAKTRAFAASVPRAEVKLLPKVGHGYSVERNWLPQFSEAFREVASAEPAAPRPPADVGDLPLVELPATGASRDTFAIMLSGDGGWAGLDKAVAAELNARGVPVVGWDSLRYFWTARTPDRAARDLARVIARYAHDWHRQRVLLIGYSQGADVLPFMVNRLPQASRESVAGIALIGLSNEAFFEFSVSHWITTPSGGLPVPPEVERGRLGRVACIYGAGEKDSPCPAFRGVAGVTSVELPGGHHFDGDYARVAEAVLRTASPP